MEENADKRRQYRRDSLIFMLAVAGLAASVAYITWVLSGSI